METNNKKSEYFRFLITYFSKILSQKGYIKNDVSVIS